MSENESPTTSEPTAEKSILVAELVAATSRADRAEKDIATMTEAMAIMNRQGQLAPRVSDEAIQAMRDVAIAALELAKVIATTTR